MGSQGRKIMQKELAVNPYLAPEAELIQVDETVSLSIFKRFSAWFVFFLNLFTLGIYGYFWLFIRSKTINTYTHNKIPEVLIYSVLVLYFGSIGLDVAASFTYIPEKIIEINQWSMIPIFILYITWLFSLRARLSDLLSVGKTIGLHVSGIMTFFFGSIYLQYKINEGLDALNDELVVYRETPNRDKILDSDLVIDEIDYSKYSRSELKDCLMNIDREKHSDKVTVIRMALERYK